MLQQLTYRMRNIEIDKWHLLLATALILSITINLITSRGDKPSTLPKVEGPITPSPTVEDKALAPAEEDTQQESSLAETDEEISPIIQTVVSQGDSLYKVLSNHGMNPQDIHDISVKINKRLKNYNLRVGQKITIEHQVIDGIIIPSKVVSVKIFDTEKTINAVYNPSSGSYNIEVQDTPLVLKHSYSKGEINESFFNSAINAGVSSNKTMEFIRLFRHIMDFQREIRNGDQFEVLYSHYLDEDNNLVKEGDILYASLIVKGKPYKIWRFKSANGIVSYFNEKGESIHKTLLRTPVTSARISSGYGLRTHPILGYSRMHKGLDYAAPRGTPVLAAGDGVIKEINYHRRGYGRFIKIKHKANYSTLYAHLDRTHKKVKVGAPIKQGEVIGYVGATGLATGPHLHYEVRVKNKQINPAKVSLPKAMPLKGPVLTKFKKQKEQIAKVIEDNQYVTVVKNLPKEKNDVAS